MCGIYFQLRRSQSSLVIFSTITILYFSYIVQIFQLCHSIILIVIRFVCCWCFQVCYQYESIGWTIDQKKEKHLNLHRSIEVFIISAKKYLKMPAATEQPAAKKEREELLWQSLKEHIMRERQKLREGLFNTSNF